MVKLLVAVMCIALVGLQFQLLRQYSEVRALRAAVVSQEEQNTALLKRNAELAAEVDSLRNDKEALEERARTERGLINKDNEEFIRIIEQSEGVDSAADRSSPAVAGEGNNR